MSDSFHDTMPSATELVAAFAAGTTTPTDAVRASLAAIERLNPAYGPVSTIDAERALRDAGARTDELAAGRSRGPLHGVPILVKDVIDVAGLPTLADSRVREGHVAGRDAHAVARLREAGAVIVGKAHTHEFAFGALCPATRNAWDREKIAGGSSGGSAVAVALGIVPMSLGTDTCGSIRIPSAFNGVVGLKPTYGRVSKAGVDVVRYALDHVGPITRTVADAALTLQVLAGRDRDDATSSRVPVDAYAQDLGRGIEGLRVGVPTNYFLDLVQEDVRTAFDAAVEQLVALGAVRCEVTVADVELVGDIAIALLMPEASAFHQDELRTIPERFGEELRGALELGATQLATHYLNAHRVRTRIRDSMRAAYEQHRLDLLAVPALPAVASAVGEPDVRYPGGETRSAMAEVMRACCAFNVTGQPALSLPCGFDAEGLPIGLSLVGRPFEERKLLRAGAAYEAANEQFAAPIPAAGP